MVVLDASTPGITKYGTDQSQSIWRVILSQDGKYVLSSAATSKDLMDAWTRLTGSSVTSMIAEIALKKICFWGISTPTTSGVNIAVGVDHPTPYSSKLVQDTGSLQARPRCGITCPYNCWLSDSGTAEICRIDPDYSGTLLTLLGAQPDAGTLLGVVHLTVAVRRTRKF